MIYSDTSFFDKDKWIENKEQLIEKWKSNEDSSYTGYYLYEDRIGLLFDYYYTGNEKIALEFEKINWKKEELSVYNKTTSFFDGTSTEIEAESYLGIDYKITKKQHTFSTDNFLDYSIVNYPSIQLMDEKINIELGQEMNRLLFDLAMLHYDEELESAVNAFYACDYYILAADKNYICIYYMESIGAGAGRPSNFEDAVTISLKTEKKVSLDDLGNRNKILKNIRNYNGVIYADRPFEKEEWLKNRDKFIKEWKENKNASYYGYYLYKGRLGLLFNYYQTGREKIALEFEKVVDDCS